MCLDGDIYVLIHFSHVRLFVIPWTVAHQAPLSMDSPGKNTGVARPSSSRSPNPGVRYVSLCLLHWQAGSLPPVPAGKPLERRYFFNLLSSSGQLPWGFPPQVSLHPQSSNGICNRIQSIFHFFFQDY